MNQTLINNLSKDLQQSQQNKYLFKNPKIQSKFEIHQDFGDNSELPSIVKHKFDHN